MTALDEKLTELRHRFKARAGAELSALDEALETGDREAIIGQSHKLAGIAGMFGYENIGEAALALEQAALEGGPLESAASPLRNLLAELAAG